MSDPTSRLNAALQGRYRAELSASDEQPKLVLVVNFAEVLRARVGS